MPTRDLYVVELAITCNDMFSRGETDLSARNIAETHFTGKALGNEITGGIRKRLGKIRDVLETDFDHPVCLLSDTFFARYRTSYPTTNAEARRCLPTGYGKSAAGIHLNVRADDLIFQEALRLNLTSGAGKVKRSADRTLAAMEGGRLSDASAGDLLLDAGRRAAPDRPELADRATRVLPAEATE